MTSKDIARFIGKHIWLRKLGYLFIRLTTLREWYIHRALNRILRKRRCEVAALDAGFGLGQHTYDLARRAEVTRVTAIELDGVQVSDMAYFLHSEGFVNVDLRAGDIQEVELYGSFDLIVCCSVLEHLTDDVTLLRRFHSLLTPGGNLLIYVPTSEQRVLKCLENKIAVMTRALGEALPHGHVRYDQPPALLQKLAQTGFDITGVEISYGPWGRLAYDVVTMVQFSRFFKVIFPVYLILIHPFVMILMLVDFYRKNEEGNGLLVVAQRP